MQIPEYPVKKVGIKQYPSSQHPALDFGYDTNADPLYAIADGKVVQEGYLADGAIVAMVEHTNIIESKKVYAWYGHCSRTIVSVGDTVKQGEIIAYIGNTGTSAGTHLHFELWICPADFVYTKYSATLRAIYAVDPRLYLYLYPHQTMSSNAAYTKGVMRYVAPVIGPEPVIEPEPIAEPVIEPAPIIEPEIPPITEPIIEPIEEPIIEPPVVDEPIIEPVDYYVELIEEIENQKARYDTYTADGKVDYNLIGTFKKIAASLTQDANITDEQRQSIIKMYQLQSYM